MSISSKPLISLHFSDNNHYNKNIVTKSLTGDKMMNFKDQIEHLKTFFYPICKKCHLTDPLADYGRLYRPSRWSRRNTFLLCHEFCDRLPNRSPHTHLPATLCRSADYFSLQSKRSVQQYRNQSGSVLHPVRQPYFC